MRRRAQYRYIRFQLVTEELMDECRTRLQQSGVECVQQGGAHEAFGIVEASQPFHVVARQDPHIKAAEVGTPPSGF